MSEKFIAEIFVGCRCIVDDDIERLFVSVEFDSTRNFLEL